MNKYDDEDLEGMWEKVRHYYLTHDDIEMFLFACIFALLGWAGYHAIVAIVEKLTG